MFFSVFAVSVAFPIKVALAVSIKVFVSDICVNLFTFLRFRIADGALEAAWGNEDFELIS